MKKKTSNAVTATLLAAGLKFQEGALCKATEAGPHPDDYPAMMLHFHALATADDFPDASAAELRERVADILESIQSDIGGIVDDLRGEDELAAEMAEDDRQMAAWQREMAGTANPGDTALLAKMRLEVAEDFARMAAGAARTINPLRVDTLQIECSRCSGVRKAGKPIGARCFAEH